MLRVLRDSSIFWVKVNVGVIDPIVCVYVYIGPRAQSEDIK